MQSVSSTGKPNTETLDKVRSIPGRRWNPDLPGKPWVIPATSESKVISLFGEIEGTKPTETTPVETHEPTTTTRSGVFIHGNGGDVLEVRFGYDPTALAKFKSDISQRKAVWKVPRSGKTGTIKLDGWKFECWQVPLPFIVELVEMFPNANLDEKARELHRQQTELRALANSAKSDFEVPGLKGDLMPFQRAGIQYIVSAGGRCILADEQGLGKTIQAIGYLQYFPELRPAIILMPATVKGNWPKRNQ